jgi:hypothetical protein
LQREPALGCSLGFNPSTGLRNCKQAIRVRGIGVDRRAPPIVEAILGKEMLDILAHESIELSTMDNREVTPENDALHPAVLMLNADVHVNLAVHSRCQAEALDLPRKNEPFRGGSATDCGGRDSLADQAGRPTTALGAPAQPDLDHARETRRPFPLASGT